MNFPFRWRGARALLLPHERAGATDVVAQALALSALLPLVEVLEAWLGTPLRFEPPCPPDAADTDTGLMLRFEVGRDGGPAWCEVALPVEALCGEGLGLGPIASGWALRWPRLSCDALIQTWPGETLDAGRFERGALLLMPGTFTPAPADSDVRLLARLHGRSVGSRPARWRCGERTLRLLAPDDRRVELPQPTWALVAPGATSIDAERWFGGAARGVGNEVPIELDSLELRHQGTPVARGRLHPIGRGFGLLIEQLCADDVNGRFGPTPQCVSSIPAGFQ